MRKQAEKLIQENWEVLFFHRENQKLLKNREEKAASLKLKKNSANVSELLIPRLQKVET